ncbi:MAG: hypothetical protein DRI61_13985 [Chloroflexi bacterium]|nr:MAG: hypothetical protein DRI61_13985 [Chloroflexota bacterium]
MITPEVIISYPSIFEPKENPSGAMKYSCSILIDKSDKKGVADFEKAVATAIQKGRENIPAWKNKVPKFRYPALRDGDQELEDGTKTDPIYEGKLFIKCSSNDAPGVVGPDAKPLMNQDDLYAGCIVRLDVNPFPYSNSGNNGIGWGLNNVMLVREGERLDGRKNAETAFGAFASNESDDLM